MFALKSLPQGFAQRRQDRDLQPLANAAAWWHGAPMFLNFLDELRARTSLSALIQKSVKLTRAGREMKGCCPFHNEKTPSFYVNDEKAFYHCFGCGAHGDAIGFEMRLPQNWNQRFLHQVNGGDDGKIVPALGAREVVGDAKIAALGLRIKKGCCYHGLSFNVDMDLTPFAHINPCGYQGLRVTQCVEQGVIVPMEELQAELTQNLVHGLQHHLATQSAHTPK